MRYVTAGGWSDDRWDEGESFRPDVEVDERRPVRTGLITARGEPIYRLPAPIGFGRDNEW